MTSSSVDPSSRAFFDAKYRTAEDPWDFAIDPYELGRYRDVMVHVDPDRHRRVFEPGCSIGVLTEMLGGRCEVVDASDLSEVAVQRARRRCAHLPGVTIEVGHLSDPPAHNYELIVLSEVGYYLTEPELERAIEVLTERLTPGGRLIAAHWIGMSADHRLRGHRVHDLLADALPTWVLAHHAVHLDESHDGYRLDVWDRP